MKIQTFRVRANLPEKLKPLEDIAYNLWFSWNFDAIMLFIRMDFEAWTASGENPANALGLVSQERLEELSTDDSYLAALADVHDRLQKYRSAATWKPVNPGMTIAYFSMEYGLDHCLPMYSGGLGVLSGDHLKTASDLGLPLIGVGLLYRQGYFRQYLNPDGFQQEAYPEYDWHNMPVRRVLTDDGTQMQVTIDLGDRKVTAGIWKAEVGRINLYLLDTNVPENDHETREITATLYGGDRNTRIQQEIVLGVGGIHLLRALGIEPTVYHINEGHSAFLNLERIRLLMQEKQLSLKEASKFVWSTSVFTTHTPVPAGNERFAPDLMERYFRHFAESLGMPWKDFMALGRENPDDENEEYCMTVLALNLAASANGVSKLHGDVSRSMWQNLWPGLLLDEIPIGHVTNGVHPRTWIAHENLAMVDRYFGPRFHDEPHNLELWKRIDRISDEELWRAHERRREHMVANIRRRSGKDVLSPSVLTITVARRFATYKRASLLLRDPGRLIRLITDNERPIQIIFGGKAHPHDIPGKELIQEIYRFSRRPEVRSRVVFAENYDIGLARYLTSGSDVWLNTPRRTFEASGTSGMKASINGVLNVSILDGWWDEAFDPGLGWAVGSGEEYDDQNMQDEIESKALYDLLEREIIPSFYDRGVDGLPRDWIRRMKLAISTVGAGFASHRMLMEYNDDGYEPASARYADLSDNDYKATKDLARYYDRLTSAWDDIKILEIGSSRDTSIRVGDDIEFHARVELGSLSPDDILVELVHGPVNGSGGFRNTTRIPMECRDAKAQPALYSVTGTGTSTGLQGYSVRILPKHPALAHSFVPGLVKWAEDSA